MSFFVLAAAAPAQHWAKAKTEELLRHGERVKGTTCPSARRYPIAR